MTTRRSQTTYATIRTEGGLLPPDLLDRILKQDTDLGGLAPKDYQLPTDTRLMAQMSEAWQAIQTHFASFRRTMELVRRDGGTGTSETRAWVQQVLRELGYRELRFVPGVETAGGRGFLISHRAGETENAPPLHIVSFRQDLDERTSRTGGGGEQRSPRALVQGYLNASDHLWGVVTNGLVFRLLRENRQMDRTPRVDFDLEAMLEAESFAEFQLFWLVLHRSRFVQPGERRGSAWLERWSRTAASEGTRALTGLRAGVERAIEALGQGLLAHPDNVSLRHQLQSNSLTIDAYYSELLRLVYRLLFLLVAEERQLLFGADINAGGPNAGGPARYRKYYSIERLRGEASRIRNREAHRDDLWRGLLVTFDAMRFEPEAHALGLEPLGGGLFGPGSCPNVADNPPPGYTVPPGQGWDRTAGRPLLANAALLDAISALSEVTRDGVTRRINYRDLDVEELGSVYEGLLERRPALEPLPNGGYRFGFSDSTTRRETGSYYTPRGLVQELLTSALDPVIEAALARAAGPEAQERALLELNVCDPACGSGHFLLGAARRIGRRLAEVRAGAGREPEPGELRRATAEAIRRCVYGVDKNPLAIDLCKVALWIESHEPGGPIGFLDHHIKRGDSLVGVFDLDVLEQGIPDGAYTPVTGDERQAATDLKRRNRGERSKLTVQRDGRALPMHNASLFNEGEREDILGALAAILTGIELMPEQTMAEVQAKADAYDRLQGRNDWQDLTAACDLWTWAFFAPLTRAKQHLAPTSATVRQMIETGHRQPQLIGAAQGAGEEIGFFHWRLEFPDVFGAGTRGGGFDAVLGNPPWERVKLQEQEFFAERAPEIANAPNAAARGRLIRALPETDPKLAQAFEEAKRLAENASLFMRTSERFPLTGRGDVNLYSVFAEQFRRMLAPTGRAGVIVPTGIATDDTNKHFFADIVDQASLAALYDFENRRAIFENVHRSYKFSLMVLAGAARQDARFQAGFFLLDPVEIHEPERTFLLGAGDIALLNPNTRTCPIFRTARDAELTKAIYRTAPVLVDENAGAAGNPWGVTFKRMLDMSNDSHLFRTRDELETQGATLGENGRFRQAGNEWLPLYEAKLIHQFDHRFATYERDGSTRDVTTAEHADPNFVIAPRYWLETREVERVAGENAGWFMGFRDIARNTDERTAIISMVPWAAVGNNCPLLLTGVASTAKQVAALQASLSTFVLDYAARMKVGGTHLNFFIAKQFPVLPPESYTEDLLNLIVPRVLELVYTSHDMAPVARDLGYDGPPFAWNEERRAELRAELDGIYAHLYGISRDDFAYILDTFPIVARKDIAQHGEYLTKRLCLEAYDHFAPETLRALELEVRLIEQTLRRVVARALDNDVDALPAEIRAEILEERSRHRPNGAGDEVPPLRELLESSYLRHLDKIIRTETVWPLVEPRFQSRSQFKRQFGRLNSFRNPLAHGRGVGEDIRRGGEEAIAWFRDTLELVEPRAPDHQRSDIG